MENLEERQRIGDIIRKARKNKKITQTQLGAEIGVGVQVISDYEKGKVKVIPFERRSKLAILLGIPLEALIYEDEKVKGGVIPAILEIKAEHYLKKDWSEYIESTSEMILTSLVMRVVRDNVFQVVQENRSKVMESYQKAQSLKLNRVIDEKLSDEITNIVLARVLKDENISIAIKVCIIGCLGDICSEILSSEAAAANDKEK